ncbi:MAG: putative hydrolase of the HAD superfamily [Limisphaerales bacterium]|jgi:putative hydrolase of the HAD superfamily
MGTIKAITFDLWDTLVIDDSDEPKRAERGLRSKFDERRHLLWEALNADEPIGLETVCLAYSVGDVAFNKVWKEHHITWHIADRLRVILNGLGRELPEAAFDAVVRAHAEMEVDIPPDAIPGGAAVLERLAKRFKLCIISDSIVSPGSTLRRLLEKHGLAKPFSGFAFSDEVGHSKPHRAMFDSAAEQLGVGVGEILHVGDRDHNDVKGPQRLGMKAILFTAANDTDKAATTADAICGSFDELESAIDRLNA